MLTREKYVHSGRFTMGGALGGLAAGLAAGIVLAFAYPYAILYIPIVGTVTFLISGGFGALVGITTGSVLEAKHVRNKTVATVVALLASTAAFLLSWVVWVYAFLRRADVDVHLLSLLFNPTSLWETIQEINAVGAWRLKNATPTGTVLWVLWAGEALIILGVAAMAVRSVLDVPYCEACERWSTPKLVVLVLASEKKEDFRRRVDSDKLVEAFTQLGPPPPDAPSYTSVGLHSCEGCNKLHALTATAVRQVKKKKETSVIVEQIVISSEEALGILDLGKKLAPATA